MYTHFPFFPILHLCPSLSLSHLHVFLSLIQPSHILTSLFAFQTLTTPPSLTPSLTRPQLTFLANSASGGPCPGSQSQHSPPRSRCRSVVNVHTGSRGQARLTQKMWRHVLCLRVTFVHIFILSAPLFVSSCCYYSVLGIVRWVGLDWAGISIRLDGLG